MEKPKASLEKLKLSLADICAVTGEDITNVRGAINRGDLVTFLVGRRRFARPEAVRAWVDYLEAQSNAGTPVVYQPRPERREAA